MHFAAGDAHEYGDAAHAGPAACAASRLPCARESGPKETKPEIDGGGVERVSTVLEIFAEGFVSVELARASDQDLGEVHEDAPVVALVGVGQSGAGDAATKAHVIELAGSTAGTFDIAQALAVRELSEGHAQELVPAREATQRRNSRSGRKAMSCENTVRPRLMPYGDLPPFKSRQQNKALSDFPSAACPDRSVH